MIEGMNAEDFEIWRSQEATVAVIHRIRKRREQALERMAGAARSSPEMDVRVAGGRIAGFDEVLEMFDAKGKK